MITIKFFLRSALTIKFVYFICEKSKEKRDGRDNIWRGVAPSPDATIGSRMIILLNNVYTE